MRPCLKRIQPMPNVPLAYVSVFQRMSDIFHTLAYASGALLGGGGGGGVMSAVAVLKSSMSLFETCQMSPSEFRTNSAITWTTRFLYIGLIAYNHFVVTC